MGAFRMNTPLDQQSEDAFRFLQRAEIFEPLAPSHLKIILERGKVESYATPGSVLFELGEPADAIFVVKSGVVEICRSQGKDEAPSVVAYLGEGDTIGEMAITTGSPRGSLARIPQKAEVFKLTKSAFTTLLHDLPEFSTTLLSIMSKRLEDRLRKQRVAGRYQHLSGDLQYFDLATVVQALAGAGRSGTLDIRGASGDIFAEIYFDLGRIRYAKLGALKGKQAVFQLFLAPVQQSFTFQSGPLPADFTDEEEIMVSTTGLLMESVHLMDELRMLKSEYPDDQRTFRLNTKHMTWEDPDTLALAGQIWDCLQRQDTIAGMIRDIPSNEASIYMVLSEMRQKGLIS